MLHGTSCGGVTATGVQAISGQFQDYYRTISGPFQDYFRTVKRVLKDHSGPFSQDIKNLFRAISGLFQKYFRTLSLSSFGHPSNLNGRHPNPNRRPPNVNGCHEKGCKFHHQWHSKLPHCVVAPPHMHMHTMVIAQPRPLMQCQVLSKLCTNSLLRGQDMTCPSTMLHSGHFLRLASLEWLLVWLCFLEDGLLTPEHESSPWPAPALRLKGVRAPPPPLWVYSQLCQALLSASDPATGLCAPELASQPLFQPL